MRVVLYARVSSEKQAEKDLSIPAQLKALRKYALQRNWEIVTEYIDGPNSDLYYSPSSFDPGAPNASAQCPSLTV